MIYRRDPLANPEELIRRVYAYVAMRLGDGADAEDVTSTTLERAIRFRDGYRPEKGEPIAWMIGIARRAIAAHVAQPHLGIEFDEAFDEPASGDIEADSLARLELARALAILDERGRELVALRYGADLTARQIGELLGLRTNTVEVALHRAVARLRSELESEQPAAPAADAAVGL